MSVTDAEISRVESLLGDHELQVDKVVSALVRAGAKEALAYATGDAVFSSMADLRMYRVRLLIECDLPAEISEPVIAALFKVTDATARRMIAHAVARYRHELRPKILDVSKAHLDKAYCVKNGKWELELPSGFVRESVLNVAKGTNQPDPTALRGNIWSFSDETYQAVRNKFKATKRAWSDPT